MEKKKTKKKKSVQKNNYLAKMGCWNCDTVHSIKITKGITVPDFIIDTHPQCKKCGCISLKPYIEWNTEKEIMKDLVLHHRIEQMHEPDESEVKNDHHHIG